jgi:enoyl-CoA hydratase
MDVTWSVVGQIGELVLDRPKALNALTLPMIRALRAGLDSFVADEKVRAIVIRAAGEKAFCAGGDVREVREMVLRGDPAAVHDYFAEEYALNAAIAACPKPYVALIDGICMGGGLGLSVHGRYRVVTERARFAMPETAIGFFPEVGGTFFLPRLPGATGRWLGLTGARLAGAATVTAGLATHATSAARLPALLEALRNTADPVDDVLAAFAEPVPPGPFAAARAEIDALFAAESLDSLFAAAKAAQSPFGREVAATLGRMSPHSLAVTDRLLAEGRDSSLATCLARELATADEITRHPDFAEGIRAVLVDKDGAPKWQPA